MREILFKAKRLDNGEWFEGVPVDMTPMSCFEKLPKEMVLVRAGFADWGMPRNLEGCKVDPETVCQYTGLTDKNGAKIFEGDKLSDKYGDTGVVKFGWSYGACGFFCEGVVDDITDNDLLVIGNIYDKEADHED